MGCVSTDWNNSYGGSDVPTLTLPDGTDKDVSMVKNWGADMNQLAFEFSQYNGGFTEEGVYTLTVPAEYTTYTYDDMEYYLNANALVFTWEVKESGVDLIYAGEDGAINVYTVDGVQVVKNGTAADVRNLRGGIYVINGKKVYLRK